MRKPRLTKSQLAKLVEVARSWGRCSHCRSYVPTWLLREPTREELNLHWHEQCDDLHKTRTLIEGILRDDATNSQASWREIVRLARHASSLVDDIDADDRNYGLWCLTDEAKEIARRELARLSYLPEEVAQ